MVILVTLFVVFYMIAANRNATIQSHFLVLLNFSSVSLLTYQKGLLNSVLRKFD